MKTTAIDMEDVHRNHCGDMRKASKALMETLMHAEIIRHHGAGC